MQDFFSVRAGAAQTQLLEEIKLKAEIRVVVQILLEVQTLTSLSSTGALFACLFELRDSAHSRVVFWN